MGFFDTLFENKAQKKPTPVLIAKDSISRAVVGGAGTWGGYGTNRSRWDIERTIDSAYERVIWVFRCVDAIASNQASVPMYLKEYDTESGHKIEDKALSKLLNHRTNPFEDAWTFRYRLSSQLLLSSQGAFIELVKSGSGDVVQMYLLDPGTVEPVKDPQEWVTGYKVKRRGGVDILDREDVIWLRTKPHPIDVYTQMTAIIPATLPIETDYLARIFNRNFLRNDGRPGMLIGVHGDISSEDAEELRQLFSGGYMMAGQTRVIESDGIDVVDLQSRPRDAQWDTAIQNSKDDILLAFGVPESVLGNASGRCLRASEKVFLATGEIKRAEELVGQKFQLLQPTYDDGEYQVVNAVAEYAKKEPIYKITTFSGRTLEANAEHPLFMSASASKGPFKRDIFPWGWTKIADIKKHFDKNDAHGTNLFTEVAVPISFDQTSAIYVDYDTAWEAGELGQCVPDYLFTADVEAQRAFVSGLYSKQGLLSQHTSLDLYPPSREYAVRLQYLLQRLGVHATIGTKKLKHLVSIGGKINMFVFLSQLELTGDNADKAKSVWERLSAETSREHNAFRTDGLPSGVIWDRIYSVEELGEDQTVALTVEGDSSYLSMFWEHNTYNNADSEEENFWTKTMLPHCNAIARQLEPLTGSEDDEKFLTFDYSTVDVLQRIQRRKEDEIKQDFARGLLTGNQVLAAMGLPEVDAAYMRVYYHPSRLVGGADDADVEEVRNLPVIGQTLQPGPGFNNPFANSAAGGGDGTVGGTNDLVQGALAANGTDIASQTVNDQAARTLRSADTLGIGNTSSNPNAIVDVRERVDRLLNKKEQPHYEVKQIDTQNDPHRDLRGRMQGFVEGHLDSWSRRQLDVVKDRVNHVKVRKGTRHWDGADNTELKSLDVNYIVNTKEWAEDAYQGILENTYSILLNEAHKVANTLLDSGHIVKVDGKSALESLLGSDFEKIIFGETEIAVGQIAEAATNQSNLLSNHIAVLDISGKSIEEIQGTLTKEAFDRSRWSINLAKMVTTNAIERIYDTLYSAVDGKAYKIWCAGKTEHYREGHGQLHGTKSAVDGNFTVNGTSMKYPTEGFDDESIACSCWLYYGIDE